MSPRLAIFPLAVAFLGGGCHIPTNEEIRKAPDRDYIPTAKACAAAQEALEAKHGSGFAFGPCNAAERENHPNEFIVAISIQIPHTDEYGRLQPDTFYYLDAQRDPATEEVRIVGKLTPWN